MNKPFTKNSFLLLPISLMLIIGLTLVSCGSSPQNVIKQWHTAVEKGNDSAINNLIVPGSNLSRSMLAGGLHRETFLRLFRVYTIFHKFAAFFWHFGRGEIPRFFYPLFQITLLASS